MHDTALTTCIRLHAGSLGGCGGGADSDSDDELARELAAAGGGGSKSAADPIGLLVQLTALKSKSRCEGVAWSWSGGC